MGKFELPNGKTVDAGRHFVAFTEDGESFVYMVLNVHDEEAISLGPDGWGGPELDIQQRSKDDVRQWLDEQYDSFEIIESSEKYKY